MSDFKLLLISALIILNSGALFSQCGLKNVQHKTSIESKNITDSQLEITLEKSVARTVVIDLFKIDVTPEKVDSLKYSGQSKIQFDKLGKGQYVVFFKTDAGCKFMLGGIDGIEIKGKGVRQ